MTRVWDGTDDPNGRSSWCSLSRDGRWVAFDSRATNLVPGDTNGVRDVFVFDRLHRAIERVSTGPLGVQGNGNSALPSISGDGRFVAFESLADNLVASDTNDALDIFVHDRATGVTTRVSEGAAGEQGDGHSEGASLSADGTRVAFTSLSSFAPEANADQDVFVKDLTDGSLTLVTVTPSGGASVGDSYRPQISADGSHVVFQSQASDLVADDTNGTLDVFIADLASGTIRRVSEDSAGNQSNGESEEPSVSANGDLIVFHSSSTDLVPGDTNGVADVFLRDLVSGQTSRLSVAEDGTQATAASREAAIAWDGSVVAFETGDDSLIPGDANGRADVLVLDRTTGELSMASITPDGVQGNNDSELPSLSGDGRFVGFESASTSLDPDDARGAQDIFIAGPHFTLDVSPSTSAGDDFVRFDIWRSTQNHPLILYYEPSVGPAIPLFADRFDADGTWSLLTTVPPGVSGTFDFRALALTPDGKAAQSNLASITIQ